MARRFRKRGIFRRLSDVTETNEEWIGRERARQSMREAMLRYFRGADRKDGALYESAFATGAKLWIDGIQRRGEGALPPDKAPQPVGVPMGAIIATSHHLHQSEIVFTDGGADCESLATAYVLIEDAGERKILVRGLRYLDRMVEQDGEWRILERHHNVDWMYVADAALGRAREERAAFAALLEGRLP